MGKFKKSDSADTCTEKFPLVSMGGRAEGLACTDPGARTPIGASGNFLNKNRQFLKAKSEVVSPDTSADALATINIR